MENQTTKTTTARLDTRRSSPATCSRLVVGMAALSNQIFVGRLCKDGRTWREGKQDVTSDVLQAIIQYVEPGHEIDINVGGVPKYRIRVTEISSENAKVMCEGASEK